MQTLPYSTALNYIVAYICHLCFKSKKYLIKNKNIKFVKNSIIKIAIIIDATGLVGSKMIELLTERQFPVSELIPAASKDTINKIISFNNNDYQVISIEQEYIPANTKNKTIDQIQINDKMIIKKI